MILQKSFICEILGAPRKEQCYVAVSKCMLFLFYFLIIYFVLKLFTQRQCVKVTFLKFQVLRERSSVIASFPEHPAHSNFEMFSVLIIRFLFWLDFPEHPVYDTFEMFSVLILGLLFWFPVTYPKNMCESNLFFVILGAPKKKKQYCFFRGAPCI